MFFCHIKIQFDDMDHIMINKQSYEQRKIFSIISDDFAMKFFVVFEFQPLQLEYVHSAQEVLHFVVLESFH